MLASRAQTEGVMSSHLWLAAVNAETLNVFAAAFTLSSKKRGCPARNYANAKIEAFGNALDFDRSVSDNDQRGRSEDMRL